MAKIYQIGVMRAPVGPTVPENFKDIVDRAVEVVENTLSEEVHLEIRVFDFIGPHLTPSSGAYSPLDFLELGMAEKPERNAHFLLVVTEVDLSTSSRSYVLAFPSLLTNIGVISTKRLFPTFWGHEEDVELTVHRLAAVMLHTLGHLLNLSHHEDPHNVMHDFADVEELAQMKQITPAQVAAIIDTLPEEARNETAKTRKWWFALRKVAANGRSIWRALRRANPLALVFQLPTMITAALSVAIVLFFTAEIWDVGSSLPYSSAIVFSLLSIGIATALLYSAFRLNPGQVRTRGLTESAVVTAAATLLTLLLTMFLLYLLFFLLTLFSSLTFFPAVLKETWPTSDPAVHLREEIKLSLFIAATAVLTGSLGGRADSQQIIRSVLFLDEET